MLSVGNVEAQQIQIELKMQLKCIGGPNDGEWIDVDDHYRQHDFVKVSMKSMRSYLSGLIIDDLQACIAMEYNIYRIEILKFRDKDEYREFKCLIPQDADLWDTIVNKLKS